MTGESHQQDADAVLAALQRTELEERDRNWLLRRLRRQGVDVPFGATMQGLVDLLNKTEPDTLSNGAYYTLDADTGRVLVRTAPSFIGHLPHDRP
jgi:hypothetical protein